MKHFHLLILLLTAISTSKAMENNSTIEKMCFAQYLTDDRVVLVGEANTMYLDFDKPAPIVIHIVNPKNNELIKEITKINKYKDTYRNIHLAVHPNKKKIALSYGYSVAIYNTETGEKEWYKDANRAIDSSAFSPLDDSIVISYPKWDKRELAAQTIKHYYETEKQYTICAGQYIRPRIALHPTQNIMCAGNHKGKLFLYPLDNVSSPKIIKTGYTEKNYQYTHDGSFIIANGGDTIYIVDPTRTQTYCSYCCKSKSKLPEIISPDWTFCPICGNPKDHPKKDFPKELKLEKNNAIHNSFCTVAMYPYSSILVTLSSSLKHSFEKRYYTVTYTVKYWNILTQECIHTSPTIKVKSRTHCNYYDLSFSPDGTKLLAVFENDSREILIPLEIQQFIHLHCQHADHYL